MTKLYPLPSESRTNRDIVRMEHILCLLRNAAIERRVESLFCAHDQAHGHVKFSNLHARHEVSTGFLAYYDQYGLSWRSKQYGDAYNPALANNPGPQWVRFSTESRRAWLDSLQYLLQPLNGLPLSVTRSISWRWDHVNTSECGQPTYVPVYEAMVALLDDPDIEFNADEAFEALTHGVCTVDHPLADKHLFDWQREVCGKLLFRSYTWCSTGFVASFFSKQDLEQAQELLFAPYETTVQREGRGQSAVWRATVNLPVGQAVTS